MPTNLFLRFILAWLVMGGLFPDYALAYIGPGSGLSAIGAALGVVAGIVVAIIGFVWYPIRRLIRGYRKTSRKEPDGRTECSN